MYICLEDIFLIFVCVDFQKRFVPIIIHLIFFRTFFPLAFRLFLLSNVRPFFVVITISVKHCLNSQLNVPQYVCLIKICHFALPGFEKTVLSLLDNRMTMTLFPASVVSVSVHPGNLVPSSLVTRILSQLLRPWTKSSDMAAASVDMGFIRPPCPVMSSYIPRKLAEAL